SGCFKSFVFRADFTSAAARAAWERRDDTRQVRNGPGGEAASVHARALRIGLQNYVAASYALRDASRRFDAEFAIHNGDCPAGARFGFRRIVKERGFGRPG